MKRLLILGAGTGGTLLANRMARRLPAGWELAVVDPSAEHLYQPGLLYLPFNSADPAPILRARGSTLRKGVPWIQQAVEVVDPDRRQVVLADGVRLSYDLLVIASGSHLRPEETEGLTGDHWREKIFDFYTLEGALGLRKALAGFHEGRFVVNIVEMPIKCPVAPLELLFLADDHFTRRGIRDQVELVLATPLDGAFTRPLASRMLGDLFEQKGIRIEAEFSTGSVDTEASVLRSWDEREVPYDLLVTVPTHMGASFVEASGLGDDLAFIPTHHHTLLSREHDHVFVMGDATNLPSSKAGSVAHFQGEILQENILRAMAGRSLVEAFDGHSNCFIESGFGKAILIDFNYDVEPLPGVYPWPLVGPLSLLRQARRNHWGKQAFRWVYWNILLPARPLPVTTRMSMAGKRPPSEAALRLEKETADADT